MEEKTLGKQQLMGKDDKLKRKNGQESKVGSAVVNNIYFYD